MANDVFVNIKDLPELDSISNGSFFIVETSTGTKILDFENLILPSENTSITTTVDSHTTKIDELDTNFTLLSTQFGDLGTNNDTNSQSISTISEEIQTLSNSISALSATSSVYIGKVTITIESGNSQASDLIIPSNTSLQSKDITITPANLYAAKNPAFVYNVTNTGQITIKAAFSGVAATEDATYNLVAFKP